MQYTVFLISSPVVAACMVAAGIVISRQRRAWLTRALAWSIWLCLAFLVTNTLELVWPTEQGTMLFAKLSYLASTPIPVVFFLFTLSYVGRSELFAGPSRLVLFVIPTLISVLAITEPLHGLIWATVSYTPIRGMMAMNVTYGTAFWVGAVYSVSLLVVSLTLFARSGFQAGSVYRSQSLLGVVGICVPLALFLVYTLKIIPGLTKNYSPIAYCVPALCLVAAIRQHRFLDLVPIARRTLVEEMPDALVVLDIQSRILDCNEKARALLDLPVDPVGLPLPPDSALRRALETTLRAGGHELITFTTTGEERFFDAKVTSVLSPSARVMGIIVILRNVTEAHLLLLEKNRLIEELSKASDEIQNLQGMIPICMHCKKMRDDEGYWHAVEHYVSARSPAQFTHSLCPDCFAKYYPELEAPPESDSPGSVNR